MAGETFTPDLRKKLMAEIDTDGSGDIDAEEFYRWMLVNAKSDGGSAEGSKQMQLRNERLEVGKDGIDDHLMELLEEVRYYVFILCGIVSSLTYLVLASTHSRYPLFSQLGVGAVVQKVTHPLHSAFGRTLYDHFVSCYLISKVSNSI